MKRNKKLLILTTLVCLLPILAGLAVYSRLPAELPTHFGMDGTPDGWSSRPMAVFGLPCFLAAGNLLLYFSLRSDPKRANMNKTLATLCLWIFPVMSLLTSGITLGEGLGYRMHVEVLVPVLVGVIFLLLGNYLPKTKQCYTMGFKLPWTLNSEENWNRTHRLAGFLWVIAGLVMIVAALLRLWSAWIFVLLLVSALIPTVYSYLLYRKGI